MDRKVQEDFINSLKKETGLVLFVDAVHPQHNSKPSYGWFTKDQKVGILSNSGRKRINLNGALNSTTCEVIISENETIDAFSAIDLFERIQRAYPEEEKITFICDNARYYPL